MKKFRYYLFICLCGLMSITACKKPKPKPVIPVIIEEELPVYYEEDSVEFAQETSERVSGPMQPGVQFEEEDLK